MDGKNIFSPTEPTCPLSDPANLHLLCRKYSSDYRYLFYYCDTCDLNFESRRDFFPPEIRHPFHLLHPLTLTNPDSCVYPSPKIPKFNTSFYSGSDADEFDKDKDDDDSDGNHLRCKFCQKNIDYAKMYYHCSICSFSLHINCSVNKPPLNIENPKIHHHTLTLFPRRVPLPCDACGFSLSALFTQVYSCLLCNYLVHRSCIYLPRVIKITRHPHRLSHTSLSLPTGDHLLCGVCRKPVDVNYGHYSCNKGCHYAVHSKCATRKKVWDGKDLEGVPEEEEDDDIEPFVRIDEETIQHFSHEHHYLRIDGNGNHNNHENKFCQACTLPITVLDRFYDCMECDFVLHEHCACLPRKINHQLHKHPLTLFHPFSPNPRDLRPECFSKGYFDCDGCSRRGCGFIYKCNENDCDFQVDVRCASIPDPSSHESHDHPLFFNLTKGKCMGCQRDDCSPMYLECIECKLFMGLKCATCPSVAHYKHDKHPLTLCYGEEVMTTNLQHWCEICETKIDAKEWFYGCYTCQVSLHVKCLLGEDIYMKPNHTIDILGENVDILCNNGNVRPVCDICKRRSKYPFVFKWLDRNSCRWKCTERFSKIQEKLQTIEKVRVGLSVQAVAFRLMEWD